MITVVGISLGSDTRDFDGIIKLKDQEIRVIRHGVNGDKNKAYNLLKEYDGQVPVIGLGGVNLAYEVGNYKFKCTDGYKLQRAASISKVVDGSRIKSLLDKKAVELLVKIEDIQDKKIIIVSALDRPHLIDLLEKHSKNIIIGDAIFALKIPIPFYFIQIFKLAAFFTLPFFRHLPIELLYPTGKNQDKHFQQLSNKGTARIINECHIICGDFHLFKRSMPNSLENKIIITSTLTKKDVTTLKQKGVKTLITSSPYINDRSLGANIWEAIVCSIILNSKKCNYEQITDKQIENIMTSHEIKPFLLCNKNI